MKKLFLFCSCLCLLFVNSARSAVTYWDPQGTTGANPVTTSLSGIWENNLWSTSGTGQATPQAWVDNTAVCFAVHAGLGTPAFTVTMNANHNVAGFFIGPLTPNSCNTTVTGSGIITLPAGLQGFDIINASDGSQGLLTINNVITGPGTITAEGFGQIFLNGVNTFTGGVALGYSGASWSGILNYNNTGSFGTGLITSTNGSGSALVIEGTSPVNITNSFLLTSPTSLNMVGNPAGATFSGPWSLIGAGPVSLGSGSTGNLVILSGVISGGVGGITKFNNSTLLLSGANTYSGPTTVSAGVLQLGNPSALGRSTATTTSGAAIDLNGTQNIPGAFALNGTGISSAGALVNSNLATTATLVQGGSVVGSTVTAAGANITAPATITVSGGGGSGAAATPNLGVSAASFTLTPNTQKYTVAPNIVISGGGGVSATATCALAGASPSVLSSTVTITGAGYGFTSTPTVAFSGGTVSGTGTAPTITANGTHFTLRNVAITAGGSGYTSAPTLTLSTGTATATAQLPSVNLATASSLGGPGNTTINSVISGTAANGLTKVGTGVVTLTAANTYTGPTAVSAGTLALTGGGSLVSSAISVASGATFDVSGLGSLSQIGATTITGVAGATVALGTASQSVSLNFNPATFTGDASHPALTLSAGTLALNNNLLFVNNAAASPLDVGTYSLIKVGDGTTGTITGTPNSVTFVGGAGLVSNNVASVSISGSTVVLVVSAATNATTTTISATSPVNYGQSASFTATVSPVPTGGDVQFYLNGVALGAPVPVSLIDGTATSISTSTTLAAGSPSITAKYSGSPDTVDAPSVASAVSQVINPAPLTVTAKDQSTTYGTAITLSGSTQFTSSGLVNGETIGSVALTVGGGGAATEAAGIYSITPGAAAGGTFNAANYSITYVAATTGLTVNPKALTLTAKAQSKVYGVTLATGPGSTQFNTSGLVNGDTVGTVTLAVGGSPTGDQPTAPVSGSPYTETISAATGGTFNPANYTITYATGALTITKAAVTVTATAETKTYGQVVTFGAGSTLFTANLQNGETIGSVTLACTGGAANAAVSGSPYTITPSAATGGTFVAGNYTITYATTGRLTVSVLPVSLTGARSYNGTTNAAAAILSLANLVGADVVTVGGSAGLAAANAGPKPITSFGTLTLGGASAANYSLTGASGSVTINPLVVALSGARVYDGTTNAAVAILTVTNVVSGDDLTIGGTSAGLAAADAGLEPITSLDTLTLGGAAAANYTLAGAGGSVTISPLAVALAGSRTYDGTTGAAAAILAVANPIGADAVTVSGGSGTLAGANAGPEAIATFGTLTLAGASAGNYTLAGASGSVTINPLTVALSGTRAYDGTTNAAAAILSVANAVSGDVVTVGGGSAGLAAANAGSESIISLDTLTLGGAAAANYTLAGASGSVTINPLAVALTGTRTYDGTTGAAAAILAVANTVGTDVVTVGGGSATLAGANAGPEAISSVATLTLGGASAANYTLAGAGGSVTVNPLTAIFDGARAYDGTTNAAAAILSVTNVLGGDVVTVGGGSASLAGAEVGPEAITSFNTLTLGGASAGNYTLVGASGSVTINPYAVALTGSRVYDGTSNAAAAILTIANPIGTDVVTVGGGSATLAGANVGPEAITSFATLTLGGASATNYTLVGASGSVTISALAVNLAGTRAYDGTTNAAAAILTVGNAVGSDVVTIGGGSAGLAAADAGSEAITSLDTLTLGGAAAANYTLTGASGSVAISPLAVALTGARTYDGTTSAAAAILTVANPVGADVVTVGGGSATLAGSNAGPEAITSFATLTLGGASAANYTLAGASGSVTIGSLAVTLTGTRVYDGGSGAAAAILTVANPAGTDIVTVGGGSATLAGSNAGSQPITSVATLTLGGASAANYTLTGAGGSVTISPLAVAVTGTRTYDGTTGAAAAILNVANTVGADVVTIGGGSATLAGANAGPEAITSFASLTLGGASAANYTLTGASGSVSINPLTVSLTGTRPYDGTSNAPAAILSVGNLVSGDVVTIGGGSATLAAADAGSEPITSVASLTLGGASAANYTLAGAGGSVTITVTAITISSNFLDATGTNFVLTFTSVPGGVYRVLGSNDLSAPVAGWPVVSGPITATGTSTSVTNAINSPMEVFQVVSP